MIWFRDSNRGPNITLPMRMLPVLYGLVFPGGSHGATCICYKIFSTMTIVHWWTKSVFVAHCCCVIDASLYSTTPTRQSVVGKSSRFSFQRWGKWSRSINRWSETDRWNLDRPRPPIAEPPTWEEEEAAAFFQIVSSPLNLVSPHSCGKHTRNRSRTLSPGQEQQLISEVFILNYSPWTVHWIVQIP